MVGKMWTGRYGSACGGPRWLSQAGDYYEMGDDLPRADGSSGGGFLESSACYRLAHDRTGAGDGRRVRGTRGRPAPAA